MPKILAVDDDRFVLTMVTRAFEGTDIQVVPARDAKTALELAESEDPDAILLDVMLPDASGMEVFEKLHRMNCRVPVIFITAAKDSDTAIEAMKQGAFDYLRKPLHLPQLKDLVGRAIEVRRLMQVPIQMEDTNRAEEVEIDHLVGESPAMLSVYKLIGQAAPQDISVLIRGESGTGKELVARAIYQHSRRSNRPFLAINCAAIPESLLESELFGHEKGSFTGADSRRIGKFEQCNGGTIFLDEIGDMPATLQSKILRLLQEQRFERVGGGQTIATDVRIIAATNRDLESMIKASQFREDLFYRLNGITIFLPPIRDRVADIDVLVHFWLRRYAKELGKEVRTISDEALERLRSYSWPGNVREMQSVIKQAILRSRGQVLLPDFLPDEITQPHASGGHAFATNGGSLPVSDLAPLIERRIREESESLYAEAVEAMEAYLISRVLKATDGNQSHAARILGITRGSLRKKIAAAGIAIDRIITVYD